MDVRDLEEKLQAEGFRHTYIWQNGANAYYPDHTHPVERAHIILDGEMTLTQGSQTQTYRASDRVDVPARTLHSARMGPTGCRYLIGEK